MPIGSGDAYEMYFNRYEHIIRPAVEDLKRESEQLFKCVRADFITSTGSITQEVLMRLHSADAVIADLTDLNPNVFYELGVRHALRSGTVLVALKGTKPPFDVGDLRIVFYEDRVGGERVAIPQIQEMLLAVVESRRIDSPVLRAIPRLASDESKDELQAQVAALEQEASRLRSQLGISEQSNLATQALLEALRTSVDVLTSRLPKAERQAAERALEQVSKEGTKAKRSRNLAKSSGGDPDVVFVLMAFRKESAIIYDLIRHVANRVGLRVMRADEVYGAGLIIDQIYELISRAGLVIADLSGRNQNVMYELGVASAMGKEILLLSRSIDDVPFDLRHRRVLVYGDGVELRDMLQRALEEYTTKQGSRSGAAGRSTERPTRSLKRTPDGAA